MFKPTVTVGIPAFNEEANIGYLLADLLKQDEVGFRIEKIIIASDRSTDKTVQIVNSFKNNRIQLIDNPIQQGVATRQNQIIAMSESDVLLLINADILIPDTTFVQELIDPIITAEADLTTPSMIEMPPRTFVESVLGLSTKLKRVLFESWRQGQNVYRCHGTARAFSRRLYTNLRFRYSEGEDMYSYLVCVKRGFTFRYVRDVHGYYRLPSTLKDHFKQSVRYFKSQDRIYNDFDSGFISQEFNIPVSVFLISVFKAIPIIIKSPRLSICYLFIVTLARVRSWFPANKASLWQATTTKSI